MAFLRFNGIPSRTNLLVSKIYVQQIPAKYIEIATSEKQANVWDP